MAGKPTILAVDDDPVVLQQQGDGAIGGTVARGGDIGATAAVVEFAAERLDDVAQGHGSPPRFSAEALQPGVGQAKPAHGLLAKPAPNSDL